MVSSISRSIPSSAPRPPPPHYKTFLTPILHRRFARTCLVGVAVSFVEAFIITDKSSFFWALFPLGWTGLKAGLIFCLSILPVLILRVSQLHVGARPHLTIFHAAKTCLGSFGTYSVLLTHSFASLVFVLLYLWSGKKDDQLSLLTEGKSYERPRLNERFLYLVFFGCFTGFVQGVLHLAEDRGRLQLPPVNLPPKVAFKKRFPEVLSGAVYAALVSSFAAPFVYLFFRSMIWHYTLVTVRIFLWLNRSSTLPAYPVGAGMFIRSFWFSFLVGCMWQTTNLAFNIYFTQEPLALDGKTVSEKSPDPNGTLVSGLKSSQVPLTQMWAFWELNYIAQNLPARRKAMLLDINRKPTSVWEQLMKECLGVLGQVDSELAKVGKAGSSPTATTSALTSATPPIVVSPPQIPVSPDNALLATPPSASRKLVESVQSKDGSTPTLGPLIQKLPIQPPSVAQAQANITGTFKSKMEPFLASPWGRVFRQSIYALTSQVIPNVRLQVDAVKALGGFSTASLNEDEYGVVQKQIATILRAFNTTIEALEKYLKEPPIHWTDIDCLKKQKAGTLELPEPQKLLKALRATTKDIATAFAPYANEYPADIRAIVLAAKAKTPA